MCVSDLKRAFSPSLRAGESYLDTEYDRANVPPHNGNDPPPAPGSLKRSLFPTLLNEVQNKGTQGVRARYGAELPPIISIVRCLGRPVISVPDYRETTSTLGGGWNEGWEPGCSGGLLRPRLVAPSGPASGSFSCGAHPAQVNQSARCAHVLTRIALQSACSP